MAADIRRTGPGRATRRHFLSAAGALGLAGLGIARATTASAAAPASGQVFNVMTYGATGNGTTNDAPAIQAALNAAGVAGGVVTIPAGTFRTRQPIMMPNNTTLQMTQQTTLLRDFAIGGPEGATIRNSTQAGAGNWGLSVTGGILRAASAAAVGKHIAFQYVNGVRVEGVHFAGVYGDWNTAFMSVSNAVLSGLVMDSGTALYEDGIHIGGGGAITISNCVLSCGDDAISLAQEWPEFGDIEDVTIENCVVNSNRANAIRITTSTVREVRRVVMRGITGGSAHSHGVLIEDAAQLNRVRDITIDGMSMDQRTSPAAGVWVNGVRNIRLTNVTLSAAGGRPFHLQNATDLFLTRCEGAPTAANLQSLFATNCENLNVDGFMSRSATQHGIVLSDVRGGSLRGCSSYTAADSGIELNATTGIRVSDCQSKGNAWGIRLSGVNDYNNFLNNDFTGNTAGAVLGTPGAHDTWLNNGGRDAPSRGLLPGVECGPSNGGMTTAGVGSGRGGSYTAAGESGGGGSDILTPIRRTSPQAEAAG